MKKIIGLIHPFDANQTLYVYEDGNSLDFMKVKIENIPEAIFKLSKAYNVYDVDLSGAKYFSKKLIQKIQEEEMIKYNEKKLNIRIV